MRVTTTPMRLIAALLATAGGTVAAQSVGELSDEARQQMVAGAVVYESCVRRESQALLAEYPDVRALLDAAMGRCAADLERLEGDLREAKVDGDLVAGFSRRIRAQSVRKLLPEIMAALAARSPQP